MKFMSFTDFYLGQAFIRAKTCLDHPESRLAPVALGHIPDAEAAWLCFTLGSHMDNRFFDSVEKNAVRSKLSTTTHLIDLERRVHNTH
jgi:hypothetical protein